MATETLTTLANALKTYYMGPITTQLDNGSGPIMAALEKGSKYIVGNKFKFPLEYGRSGGVGARAENGSLPTASARKYAQGEAESKNLYARFMLSDKLIKTSKDSKASFVDQVTRQMENLTIDGNDMLRRNIVGKSTGVMGQVNANTSSSADFVLKAGSGVIESFYPGQLLDIGTVSAGALTPRTGCDAIEVKDVNYDTSTVTLASSVSLTANDYITLAGNYGNELTGLGDIMNTTTIYGVDRSTNKWFMPTKIDKYSAGTAQAFDSLWIQKAIDVVGDRVGEKPNFLACNAGVKRAYIDEQNTYKRNLEYMKVEGGYDLISFNHVPISDEKYMPAESLYLVNTKNMYLGRISDWEWLDADGAILHRVADRAAYEGTLVMYGELLCIKPASNAQIVGIAEQ